MIHHQRLPPLIDDLRVAEPAAEGFGLRGARSDARLSIRPPAHIARYSPIQPGHRVAHEVVHRHCLRAQPVAQHPGADHAGERAQEVAHALADLRIHPLHEGVVGEGVTRAAAFDHSLFHDIGGGFCGIAHFARRDHPQHHAIEEGAQTLVFQAVPVADHFQRASVDLLALLAVHHFVQHHRRGRDRVQVRPHKEGQAGLGVVEAIEPPSARELAHGRIQLAAGPLGHDAADLGIVGRSDHDHTAALPCPAALQQLAGDVGEAVELQAHRAHQPLFGDADPDGVAIARQRRREGQRVAGRILAGEGAICVAQRVGGRGLRGTVNNNIGRRICGLGALLLLLNHDRRHKLALFVHRHANLVGRLHVRDQDRALVVLGDDEPALLAVAVAGHDVRPLVAVDLGVDRRTLA